MKVNEEGARWAGPSWCRVAATVNDNTATRGLWFGISFWRLVVSGSLGLIKRDIYHDMRENIDGS